MTDDQKKRIKKALLDPDESLEQELGDLFTPAESNTFRIQSRLDHNLKANLGSMAEKVDQKRSAEDSFRSELLKRIAVASAETESSFFFRLKWRERLQGLRESLFYSPAAPYKLAPAALVLIVIPTLISVYLFKNDSAPPEMATSVTGTELALIEPDRVEGKKRKISLRTSQPALLQERLLHYRRWKSQENHRMPG